MAHKEVIKEVINGNGKFSTKEILIAHIQDDKEFKDYVRERFEDGGNKISENRTRSKLTLKLISIVVPIVLSCMGGLFYLILRLHKIW